MPKISDIFKQFFKYTIFLVLIFFLIFASYCCFFKKKEKTQIKEPKITLPSEEEALKPGNIGEPKEGEKPLVNLPLVISNTTGTIKGVKEDRLVILGNGSNFSDQKPRELTLIFTDSTITFEPAQKIQYQGFEGLKNLKIGNLITISSSENIRGKIEFIVNYVNKL